MKRKQNFFILFDTVYEKYFSMYSNEGAGKGKKKIK